MAAAFLLSGFTSYVTLAVAKRSLTPDDFGDFALFWSLGFFAAAICASPNEQELARSLAVRLERRESGRRELGAAGRSFAFATAGVVTLGTLGYLSGLFGEVSLGLVGVFALLVVGEAATAFVRGEMSARRDTGGLVVIVGGQGVVRATAVVLVGVLSGNLLVSCLAVAVSAIVPVAFIPRVRRRMDEIHERTGRSTSSSSSSRQMGVTEFSAAGVRKLAIATPPRALFAIGTPILAAIVAADDEVAVVGDVLAALSLTSAPVLVAAALQVVLLPRFASYVERGDFTEVRRQTRTIILLVAVGAVLGTALAALVGVQILDLLFGASPGITPAALAAMTLGAGLLFLANLLVPVSIAVREYSTVTISWVGGALCLVAVAVVPGEIAVAIGRAVAVGAAVVVGFLLWGLRATWLPVRWVPRSPPRVRRAGHEA